MLKKIMLGIGALLMLAFTFVIPAMASMSPEGQAVKVEGTIQSVDTAAGSFTVLAEDGTTVTVYAPEGFDLTMLVVGDHIKAEGLVGPDGLFAASELELQDGTEFEVEDEFQDADQDENENEDEDEIQDLNDDEDDENEVEEHEGDHDDEDSGSFQNGDHEDSEAGDD